MCYQGATAYWCHGLIKKYQLAAHGEAEEEPIASSTFSILKQQ
jgi:hypothetical protein